MAVDHTFDEAGKAIDKQGDRTHAMAQALVEQNKTSPQDAAKLELERQAAWRYFQDTGNDFLDLSPAAQRAYLANEELPDEEPLTGLGLDLSDMDNEMPPSLQERLSDALTGLDEEEAILVNRWTRGGTVVLRWGIMQDDDSEDFTLGVSAAYNDDEPADVYLGITQQRLKEWASLQGKDGEIRFARGLVAQFIGLTGEDVAVEIASALGELVRGHTAGTSPDGRPATETAIGPDSDDGDDALTDEDGS